MVAAATHLIRFTVKRTYRLHEVDLWFQFVSNFEGFFLITIFLHFCQNHHHMVTFSQHLAVRVSVLTKLVLACLK